MTPVTAILRAALARGPVVKSGAHFRFGRRLFNGATVNLLLASGEAERRLDGSIVARVIAPATIVP